MISLIRPWLVLAVAACRVATAASPSTSEPGPALPDRTPSQVLIDRVLGAQEAEYAVVIEELDRRLRQQPDDVETLLIKCRFSRGFAWSEEVTVERAADDAQDCEAKLGDARFVGNAAVQLFLLEGTWGESTIEKGEAVLKRAAEWLPEQRSELYERLANAYRPSNDKKADRYAQLALGSDPRSPQRLVVAERLIERGNPYRAQGLILAAPPEAWGKMSVYTGAQLLIRAGDASAALVLIKQHGAADTSTAIRFLHARALGINGESESARKIYLSTLNEVGAAWGSRWQVEYLKFELANGTTDQALAAYRRLRDKGHEADPFGRYRMELTLRHPGSGWQLRDLAGPLTFLAVLAACVLLPGALVALVHYRSLAKRAKGDLPAPGRWGLGSLWITMAILTVSGALAAYVFAYDAFAELISPFTKLDGATEPVTPISLAHALIFQNVLAIFCVIPLLRGLDLRQFFLGRMRILPAVGLALLTLVGTRLLIALYSLTVRGFNGTAALGDMTTQSIQGLHMSHGVWAGLGVVSVMVPLLEETVFRGIALQSLSRYMSFGWAAAIQAVAFMLLHESLAAMPVVLIIGVAAAWLVRKTGGLLAAMILHSLNNALAYASIIMLASVTGRV